MAAFFVQSASNTAVTTPVVATLSSTPIKGNLLIAVVNANVAAGCVAAFFASTGNSFWRGGGR